MLALDSQSQLDALIAVAEDRLCVPKSLTAALQRPPAADVRRRFARAAFTRRGVLELAQSLPAVPRDNGSFVILTRDLSRSGIGFLHAAELYPGERVTLHLPTGSLATEVTRCVRHGPRCYQIGVRFARAGDP